VQYFENPSMIVIHFHTKLSVIVRLFVHTVVLTWSIVELFLLLFKR